MPARDPHEVLGVSPNASQDDIKAAYRRLAKQHHPDANPGDPTAEARFREIAEAWDAIRTLKPDKRHSGRSDKSSTRQHANPHRARSTSTRHRKPPRGPDVDADTSISLEEAFSGTVVTLRLPDIADCPACHGTGAAHGGDARHCPACDGRGRMRTSDPFGHSDVVCPACHGRGRLVREPCPHCAGQGERIAIHDLPVAVPAGVEDGTLMRLKEQGPMGAQSRGDVYLMVSVRPHGLYRREGSDLFCDVAVAMHEAALGTKVELRTIDGATVVVRVPKGTQPGARLRLKGKGMPGATGRGDLYVTIKVQVPTGLTPKQEALLRKFADTLDKG